MEIKFISDRISYLRIQKGVSARDMSLSIGQNENYINNIENSKSMPSIQGLIYICDYLEVTPSEFFNEDITSPLKINSINKKLTTLNENDLNIIEIVVQRLTDK